MINLNLKGGVINESIDTNERNQGSYANACICRDFLLPNLCENILRDI